MWSMKLAGCPLNTVCRFEDSVRGVCTTKLIRIKVFIASSHRQKALNQTKWKEYFSGGRKYYYNVRTSMSLLIY